MVEVGIKRFAGVGQSVKFPLRLGQEKMARWKSLGKKRFHLQQVVIYSESRAFFTNSCQFSAHSIVYSVCNHCL